MKFDGRQCFYLGSSLRLLRLLLVVSGDALGLDTLGLLVNLVIGTEEVDLVVVLLSSGGSGRSLGEGLAGGA